MSLSSAERVNAVALCMQGFIQGLDQKVTRLIGDDQHEIILIIGAGDVQQYASNTTRDRGIEAIRDLFMRWSLGLPQRMPGEVQPAQTEGFEYLLSLLEKAIAEKSTDTAAHRENLVTYVGQLLAEVNRSRAR